MSGIINRDPSVAADLAGDGMPCATGFPSMRKERTMFKVHEGQCGLCVHYGEIEHRNEPALVQIRTSKSAPEDLVEECGHPKLAELHLVVTPISGCTGFELATPMHA